MDTIVFGKKGSGKSYYAVYQIINKENPEKTIHNIEGLKEGKTFKEVASSLGVSVLDLFKDQFYDKNSHFYREDFETLHDHLFVVDEAADLFPYSFKEENVLKFFRMTRHYAIDIILITQFIDSLSKQIHQHSELTIKALPDSANPIPGRFTYQEMSGREVINTFTLPKKKAIFSKYKSFKAKTTRTKKTPVLRKILVIVVIFTIVCPIGFFLYLKNRKKLLPEHSQPTQHTQRHNSTKNSRYSSSQDIESKLYLDLGGYNEPLTVVIRNGKPWGLIDNVFYPLDKFPLPVFNGLDNYIATFDREYIREQKNNQDTTQDDPNEKYR
jgi:zona occludens toxin (predicted ATPase)